MKKYIPVLYLPMIVLLSACAGGGEKETSTGEYIVPADSLMPKATTPVTETPMNTGVFSTLGEFPMEWIMLTEKEDGYVITQSCDGRPVSVKITNPGADASLSYERTQMASLYKIKKFQPQDEMHYRLDFEMDVGSTTNATIDYIDKEKGIARWTWKDSTQQQTDAPGIFVQKGFDKNYSIVRENCDE